MDDSLILSSFWATLPVYYFISALLYIVIFAYFTGKILNSSRILLTRKINYIILLSCYFHFPLIVYFGLSTLYSTFSTVLLLYYIAIIAFAFAYIIYAVRKIVQDEYLNSNKKTLYLILSSVIWFFGYFLYASQSRSARLKSKYRTRKIA
jgi:hypothetical protein